MSPVLRIGKSAPEIATGQWQLHWLGQLESTTQAAVTPFVFSYFHRVTTQAHGELQHSNECRRIRMPITDTPVFQLGTVVSEGRIGKAQALDPAFETADIIIDFSRMNSKVFSRLELGIQEFDEGDEDPSGDDPFFLRRGRLTDASDTQYNSLLVKVGGDGDIPYIFPCWSIFLFFWAPTSKWAQLMVDGRFMDSDQYLINRARSHLSSDKRRAMLWLRQWMKDEDVPYLASIVFDDYAMERGADIFRCLAQGGRARGPHLIRALPPFQGPMPLKVVRRRIRIGASYAWLVQRIDACGYQSPIQDIKFDRDNDGRSLDDALSGARTDKLPIERQKLFSAPSETLLDLTSFPHRSSSGESDVDLGWIGARFPNLEKIRAEKLPQVDTAYESKEQAEDRLAMWEREVSTLGDSSSADELAAGVNLRAQKHRETLNDETERLTLGDVSVIACALLAASGTTIEIDSVSHEVRVEALFPAERVGDYFLVPLLSPREGWQPAWRFVDKEKACRKRGLCLRITFHNRDVDDEFVRYLIDFEARLGVQNSMLVLWDFQGQRLRDEIPSLSRIVSTITEKGTTALPVESLDGYCSGTRVHSRSDATTLFRKIYTTSDRTDMSADWVE